MKNSIIIFFILINLNAWSIQKDSTDFFFSKAKSSKLPIKERQLYLIKAYNYINNNKLLKPLKLSTIAYQFYKLKDTVNFFKVNSAAMELATKTNQAYALGDTHWNLATYYTRGEIYEKAFYHFNKAYPLFINGGHEKEAVEMLTGMAHIKGRFRDFLDSENFTIRSIKLYKKLNDYENLFTSYLRLANLQKDINEFDKSLDFYEKAKFYLKFLKDKRPHYSSLYNDMGRAFFLKKKLNKALIFFDKALKIETKPKNIARILDNKAYCKLKLNDTTDVKNLFFRALKIRDSLYDRTGIVFNKIHLSDYYLYIKDTLTALKFSHEANSLAKKIKNGGDYLTSLKQLSNLDPKNSQKYLDRYIEFNDSLIRVERRMRNKFARIQFETDEYIEETERLSEQRIWILISSIGGLLILSLLYFVRVQRVQNEKLSIEAEHQKANEEVYVLTLQQQAKLEEERIKERNRISEELHDGILGKLFGTRFGLGFLPLQGTDETLEKHQSLLNELQDIEKEIRDVSHKLSDNFNSTDINFTSIIKQLLEDKSIIGNFTHSIEFDPEIAWKDVNEVTKANIYRIIQEALQNIIKHAKAKHVSLKFGLSGNSLSISIQDDGVGFNVKKGKKGIGIKNINSRLEKLKGKITIKSELGVGTTLLINTPHITIDGK